jgi:catechol 2,3-dioxygenase-like lactoylglutathione lyase family enzyme
VIDHIKLHVADFDTSKAFYEAALAPLGFRVMMEPVPGYAGFGDKFPFFWIQQRDEGAHPTVMHVAFRAPSADLVNAFHEAALAAGGSDNGAPGPRPQYHPRYHGAFVLDPDGNNVEAVVHDGPPVG